MPRGRPGQPRGKGGPDPSGLGELRRRKGLTQKDVADKLKIHAAYLSQIESGKRTPSRETLKKLASELGVSPQVVERETRRASREAGKKLAASAAPFAWNWRQRLAGVTGLADIPASSSTPDSPAQPSEPRSARGELQEAAKSVIASRRSMVSLAERVKIALETRQLSTEHAKELLLLAEAFVATALREGPELTEEQTIWIAGLFLHCLAPGGPPGDNLAEPDEVLIAFVIEMLAGVAPKLTSPEARQ